MKGISRIIFIVVLFLTVFLGGSIFFNQPNDDIFYNSMDWILFIIMLTPILIVEIEIYSIYVYGFTGEKNNTKTFFKSLSLVVALLFLVFYVLSFYIKTNKIQTVLLVVFLLYVLSKLVSLVFGRKIQNSESR